ncbi:MAG: HAD hydrolase-like protein [Candidatus Shapirobacteria bacterium]
MENQIGKKIKEQRTKANITQKELSRHLGCTEIMVSRYELGVSQISIPQLIKVANILKIPVTSFFENIDDSTNSTTNKGPNFKNAFVFDLDNTLLDGQRFCGETIARVITSIDPSINFELICDLHDSVAGRSIEDLYKHITKKVGLKADINDLLRKDEIIQSENIDKMLMFDGVVEILEFLKSNGKKLYICTNRIKSLLIKILKTNNILGYFDEVISCVDMGYKKPNPYCLIDLINRTGTSREEFIYFGDSLIDSEFAQNAGIDHIIFDQYLNNKNLFKKLINMFLEKQINGFK